MTKPTQLYRHYDKDDNLLYVGISLSAYERLSQHNIHSEWAKTAVKMTTERFDNKTSALNAERVAIVTEKPLFNIVHSNSNLGVGALSENLATEKLSTIANKRTMFFMFLLKNMSFDEGLNLMYVDLPPRMKRSILQSIGAESKNPLILSSQYLNDLREAGLVKPVGEGRYIIYPLIFGHESERVKSELRRSEQAYLNYGEEHQL